MDGAARSLRTIDQLRKGCLLPIDRVSPVEAATLGVHTQALNAERRLFEISQLLTQQECTAILENAQSTYGFCKVDSYLKTERDSDRLCILDAALAHLVHDRVRNADHACLWRELSRDQVPFGFNTAGRWVPVSVNECFRLSRYTAPSIGFRPHYDAQLCKSSETRSVWSIIIYLNDDFKGRGGETVFYTAPRTDADMAAPIAGLTVQQEIERCGGLSGYRTHAVVPQTGKGIVFAHNVLHCGAPLLGSGGVKYVLRTDLVYERVDLTHTVPNLRVEQLDECLYLFREAQNLELDGQVAPASRLYERALSLRRHGQVFDKKRRLTRPEPRPSDVLNCGDAWLTILAFSSLQEMTMFRRVSRSCRALVQRYEAWFWMQTKRRFIGDVGHASKPSKTSGNNGTDAKSAKSVCLAQHTRFIPELVSRHGTRCVFRFKDAAYVEAHKEACLRVVATYALFAFGAPRDAEAYVAEYDPEQGTVLQCSKQWLLTCAFYQLPCRGCYFHLYQTNAHNVTDDCFPFKGNNDDKDDETDRTDDHDSSSSDSNHDEGDDEDDSDESNDSGKETKDADESNGSGKGAKRRANDLDLSDSRSSQKRAKTARVRHLRVEEAFQAYVDPLFVRSMRESAETVDDMDRGEVHRFLSVRSDKRHYADVCRRRFRVPSTKNASIRPGYSELAHKVSVISHCSCSLGDDSATERSLDALYNNLICDFSRHKLRIESAGPPTRWPYHLYKWRWIATIDDLQLARGFNHASCQCSGDEISVVRTEKTAFAEHKTLNEIHITMLSDGIAFETEYAGIAAL